MDEFTRRRVTKNPDSTPIEVLQLALGDAQGDLVSDLPGYTLCAVMICAVCRDEAGGEHLVSYRAGVSRSEELGYLAMFTSKLVDEWRES